MIQRISYDNLPAFLTRRRQRVFSLSIDRSEAVKGIIEQVRQQGDQALLELTARYDGARFGTEDLAVSISEIERAVRETGPGMMEILREAADNIRRFAEKSLPASWVDWKPDGSMLGQKITPMERVAVYVPGGRAAYPSSLLMGAVPAKAAGVREVIVLTPPAADGTVNPATLAAAQVAGVDRIYKVGGAQAVAAAALGTDSIPAVDKIVGPGNSWVAEAKRQLFGTVGIDMIAGPSEVVILADESASAEYIAADLLAQAEHDPEASSILITTSEVQASEVDSALSKQLDQLPRRQIAEQSLQNWAAIVVVPDREAGIEAVNALAPEHLGLHLQNPLSWVGRIVNAGAIFIGHHAPEALGDYWAGPNHILPTAYSARFSSPLGVEDFLKRQSLIMASPGLIQRDGKKIIRFALKEGLHGHANAIRLRMD